MQLSVSMHEALGSPPSTKDGTQGCRILHQQLAYATALDKLESVVPKGNLWSSTILHAADTTT